MAINKDDLKDHILEDSQENKENHLHNNTFNKAQPHSYSDLKDYIPSDSEEFMNAKMLKYFENKLLRWKEQLLKETEETVNSLQQINQTKILDDLEAVSNEINIYFDLRTKDRARKLINKIDQALGRIQDGSYGYCQETGEPISVKRLDARPITAYSIKAQERHEALEKASKLFKES